MPEIEVARVNILSVGVIFFGARLEEMRLFETVDRIVQQFIDGQLPIDPGGGGRALDRYHWSTSMRLSSADRSNLYARVLGEPGGDVSPDVQPNSDFNGLWLRFLSAVDEFARSMAGAPCGPEIKELMEQVRKAGRDLAANASVHGLGYTYFAARRLSNDIRAADSVLRLPKVQRTYGASSPYQLIERVAGTGDVARHRALAEAGKSIFDILARNARKWSRARGPLFRVPGCADTTRPDIPDADRDTLLRSAEQWLAAAGAPNA